MDVPRVGYVPVFRMLTFGEERIIASEQRLSIRDVIMMIFMMMIPLCLQGQQVKQAVDCIASTVSLQVLVTAVLM